MKRHNNAYLSTTTHKTNKTKQHNTTQNTTSHFFKQPHTEAGTHVLHGYCRLPPQLLLGQRYVRLPLVGVVLGPVHKDDLAATPGRSLDQLPCHMPYAIARGGGAGANVLETKVCIYCQVSDVFVVFLHTNYSTWFQGYKMYSVPENNAATPRPSPNMTTQHNTTHTNT